MDIFLFKLCFTPLVVAGATLASRRWGAVTGGWLAGLPLTSGPISVFLALEQGPGFAAGAACGSLLSIPALAAFAIVYERASARLSWPVILLLALAVYGFVLGALSFTALPAYLAFFPVVAVLWGTLRFCLTPRKRAAETPSPRWDMPLRMATATVLVFAVTALAERVGPAWSGMLSCFPVLICVMTVSAHIRNGVDGARRTLYGTVAACFSFAVFFATVALCLPHLPLAAGYALALFAVAASGGLSLSFCGEKW